MKAKKSEKKIKNNRRLFILLLCLIFKKLSKKMVSDMLAKGSKRVFILFGCIAVHFASIYMLFKRPVLLYACIVFLLLFIFSFYFFRDPERNGKIGAHHMLSPADGRVVSVDGNKICIFMNVTDVHVNRIPMDGQVLATQHSKGSYFPAFLKNSIHNERLTTKLKTPHGFVELVQIAGFGFRRIQSYINTGDAVSQNQRFGVILFGSRVDVTVPESFDIHVQKFQKVRAGVTIVASLKENEIEYEKENEIK
jgi:phosphatidylserine decarboxylase